MQLFINNSSKREILTQLDMTRPRPITAQQAMHSVLLGPIRKRLRCAPPVNGGKHSRQISWSSEKYVSPLWRRHGAFLSPHGFYFRIWRRGERLARAQNRVALFVVTFDRWHLVRASSNLTEFTTNLICSYNYLFGWWPLLWAATERGGRTGWPYKP